MSGFSDIDSEDYLPVTDNELNQKEDHLSLSNNQLGRLNSLSNNTTDNLYQQLQDITEGETIPSDENEKPKPKSYKSPLHQKREQSYQSLQGRMMPQAYDPTLTPRKKWKDKCIKLRDDLVYYKKLFRKLDKQHKSMIRDFKKYCQEQDQERLDQENALLKVNQSHTNMVKELNQVKLELSQKEDIILKQQDEIDYHEEDVQNAIRDIQDENVSLKQKLLDQEKENGHLLQEIDMLKLEVEKVKIECSSKHQELGNVQGKQESENRIHQERIRDLERYLDERNEKIREMEKLIERNRYAVDKHEDLIKQHLVDMDKKDNVISRLQNTIDQKQKQIEDALVRHQDKSKNNSDQLRRDHLDEIATYKMQITLLDKEKVILSTQLQDQYLTKSKKDEKILQLEIENKNFQVDKENAQRFEKDLISKFQQFHQLSILNADPLLFREIKTKQSNQVDNYEMSNRKLQKRIWQLEQEISSLKNQRDIQEEKILRYESVVAINNLEDQIFKVQSIADKDIGLLTMQQLDQAKLETQRAIKIEKYRQKKEKMEENIRKIEQEKINVEFEKNQEALENHDKEMEDQWDKLLSTLENQKFEI